MATTVPEKQTDEVDSNEQAVVSNETRSDSRISHSNHLQNGTDNSNTSLGGSNSVTSVTKRFDMSQYLQDGNNGPHGGADSKVSSESSEQNIPSEGGHINDSSAPPLSQNYPPIGISSRSGPFTMDHPTGNTMDSNQYASQSIRHNFPVSKPGMIPPRSPGGVYPQQQPQRFMSGQSISQQAGPTPTLNQLLQTSNTMQRMQNSYGHGGEAMYSLNWSSQTPHGLYSSQSNASSGPTSTQLYRNPSPPFINRPAQPSTPNTNPPDSGELAVGNTNSNDSSSGQGAGTPNSQGMRPTPSPTGSTGSRSMSPAVGQQNIQMPPRPSSSQSDGSGPTRMSHSPMATQGGYQGPPPPPHISGYKIPGGGGPQSHQQGPGTPGTSAPGGPPYNSPQQQSLTQPHSQQYSTSQGYSVRPQSNMQYGPNQVYGPANTGQQSPTTNNMGPAQYSGRPMPNHFPGYPQSWTSSPGLNQGPPPSTNLVGSKGTTVTQSPGPQATSSLQSTNSQSPRPPHYLKTHLQHKMGFGSSNTGIISSNSPPQGYSGGGPLGPGMGPPGGPGGMHHHPGSSMGPPPMGHMTHGGMSMGPPNMAPPVCSTSNSHEGPMPPPSSTPNSHVPMSMGTPAGDNADAHDNGITTTASGTASTHVTPASGGSVTSVVTTGPDGTALDEGSQQSTLSNASAASGEDPQCSTPKSRKNEMGGHYSHPATPQSTVPSPGAASMNSLHADEYDISSPSWPRTPASPKTDSLGKLYEMDDSPERRAWLDKLLAFMEERRTPITTCPTISKSPLDLFRLYIYVKERGGFMEVTKNKTWKDIAGMLGIGASSSAAYTLRKHYTKNLLAYECKFDRGGIDPQPIINQVESTSKKKGAKSASVPSPGSSNSQDSFPTPGSSSASMDGYGGYGYPPGSTPDYNSPPMQRPASQTNAPSPHPGSGVPNHHSQGANVTQTVGGDNISVSNPFDDVTPGQSQRTGAGAPFTPAAAHQPYGPGGPPRPQGIQQGYPGQSGYGQYPGPGSSPDQYQNYPANSAYPPTTRPVGYPPYSPDGDRGTTYNQSGVNSMTTSMASMATNNPSASTAGSSPDPYNRYNLNPNAQGGTYPPPRQNYPGTATNPNASQPNAQQPMPAAYPAHQDYYRDPNYPASGGPQGAAPGNQIYGNGPHSKTMPPPAAGGGRRHPDFAKDQSQYPPYNPQKPQMYGWPNSQYRGQYTAQGPAAVTGQQWSQGGLPPRGGAPHNTQPGATGPVVGPGPGQWGADQRYPVSCQSSSVGYQPSQQGTQWNPVPTPGVGQSSPLRPAIGARPPFRPDGKPFNLPPPQGLKTTSGSGVTSSSYSQQPLPKREITFPSDSVEATVPVLYRRKRLCRTDVAPLDAWRIMMSLRSGLLGESTWALDILNVLLFDDNSVAYFGLTHMPGLLDALLEHFQRSLSDMFESPTPDTDKPWYEPPKFEERDVDLGAVTRPIDPSDHTVFLTSSTNYSMTTRKGMQVKTVSAKDDLFIQDNQKDWDVDGDCAGKSMIAEINTDPWQSSTSDATSTKHILTCFQAEFGGVPFVRLIKKKENDTNTAEDNIWSENENENNDVNFDSSKDCANVNGDAKVKLKSKNVEKDTSDGNLSDSSNNKNSSVDKCNKRTKTVSEMLTRIKKEPDEELANDGMNTIDIGEKLKTEMDAADSKASGSDVGGSNKSNASSLSMRIGINHNGSLTEEGQDSQDTIKVKTETDLSSAEESSEIPGILKQAAESSLGLQRLQINDQAGTLKRRRISDYEDEAYSRDEPSLHLITETQESLGKRCVCISGILRNLTFVPGNEMEFARNATFLSLLGKLLLLHHEHPIRTQKTRNYDREEDADFADSCSSLQGETEWWWDFLTQVRENILVASANIAGYMDLEPYDEDVSRPVLDGLLHWAVCPSAHGQDPFATVGPLSMLSPQRLALEALCKLCVTNNNVDLVIATPPYTRLERLCSVLTKLLCRSEEQVLREFAVNLLHYLAAASSGMARTVALQSPCVSLLVAFIEQAEQSALSIANQHGISALRENPDAMGTSLDMLRRAAHTLLHLARHPDNRPLFLQQEQRLLSLVMSQILDQQVATIIAKVLFQCSRPEQYQNCSTPTSTSQTSYS